VWHKISDDAGALDYATMHAWCMILRLAVAEYLDLDIPPQGKAKREYKAELVSPRKAL
jgi:hypothetical protein